MPTVEGFVNRYAFTMTVESLGQIRVWKLEGSTLIWAIRRNFETRKHIDGYPFMKVLVSTCATHVNRENERTKGEPITVKEAERLLSEEAEQIAEEIIKRHEYLFEDQNQPIFTERPGSDGGDAMVEISEERLEIPREEKESASQYLYRLVCGLSEREEIEKKTAFENMSEALRNFGSVTSNVFESLKTQNYIIAPPRNPQHTTNEILRDVLSELSDQKEINVLTARSIETLGKRGEGWEMLFKENTIQSTRQIRFANRVAVIAVAVGIVAVIVTIIFGYLSYKA